MDDDPLDILNAVKHDIEGIEDNLTFDDKDEAVEAIDAAIDRLQRIKTIISGQSTEEEI